MILLLLLYRVSYDGYSNDPNYCTASSIPNYTITDHDRKILHNLKTWQSSFQTIQPLNYKKTLSHLHNDVVFFNIACQVVSICQGVNYCVILKIWDGTRPACESFSLEEPLKNTLKANDSLKCDTKGMTIDVFLYDEHTSGQIKNVQPGDFTLLNNVHAKPEKVLSKVIKNINDNLMLANKQAMQVQA